MVAAVLVLAPAAAPAAAGEATAAGTEPAGERPRAAGEGSRAKRAERRIRAPGRKSGATIATVVAPVVARGRPGGGRVVWRVPPSTSWSGQPQQLLVLAARTDGKDEDWLRVHLPIRPNGSFGWIPARYVSLRHTDFWVKIRTRARRVSVYRSGRRVKSFGAVVGRPGTPTPHGLFALWEKNRQPDPTAFLGPWALSLTSFSDVLKSFGGGPGRVAVHGRAGASLRDPLGSARSHGCIRIDNVYVSWMARRLPRGTPVRIVG